MRHTIRLADGGRVVIEDTRDGEVSILVMPFAERGCALAVTQHQADAIGTAFRMCAERADRAERADSAERADRAGVPAGLLHELLMRH